MCVCICVCVCVWLCMYVCMYAYMYAYMYTYLSYNVYIYNIKNLIFTNITMVKKKKTELESKEGYDTKASDRTFDTIEHIFTVLYTLELLVNMYGHWFYEFFTSAWSLFDLFIVAISLFELVYMEYMAPGMYVCMYE